MKSRGIQYGFAFVGLMLLVGLACSSASTTTGTSSGGSAVTQASAPNSGPTDANTSSGLVPFKDQNGNFAIDVPASWTHTQDVDKQNNYWYWDVIASPDGNAKVESVVYNDGTPWTGSQNGQTALYLLNKFYSNTGKEGDIRVSSDSIQKDGSERLVWASKGGNYSGESFFEVRNRLTFLMLTIWWKNDFASQYESTLDDVVASYRIP